MKSRIKSLFGVIVLSLCLICSSLPALAASGDTLQVIFKDVTASDPSTLTGEAKILVSVKGAAGNVSIAQMALKFTGSLEYKSIKFLQGEDNPPECFLYTPNAAQVNATKELMPSIISGSYMEFEEETDLFVLTFSGEPGKSVELSVADTDSTYCVVGGEDINPSKKTSIRVSSSTKANEGKEAVVKIVMDKVTDFVGGSTDKGYMGSGVELKISGETTDNYIIYTVLNNTLVSKGGHSESTSPPTFTVTNTVLADDTYTVEISGLGYVTYVAEGVDFDEALEITNKDFIPGDVNGDGEVTIEDKELCIEASENEEIASDLMGAADFNRDNYVDVYDLVVFENIEDDTTTASAPAKMEAPKLKVDGTDKIEVEWKKPADNGSEITGYIIKYGQNKDNLTHNQEASASKTSTKLKDLNDNKKYYVQIAAKNAVGTGEYSDIVSATTEEESSGGGGGGGGGVGGGSTPVVTPPVTGEQTPGTTTPVTPDPNEPFTDLGNHTWAKESIYILKNNGIVGGTSATTFSPGDNIRRGDFILILTKMLGINDPFETNFADVPVGSYYYNAIGSAKVAGIAYGNGDNFMPDSSITRQDLISLSYRAFLAKGYIEESADTSSLDAFSDKDSISNYAVTAMASMVKAGIISGADGKVNPLGNASRAEVAVMCAKLLALIK